MPIRSDRSDPKLQKACEAFGKAFLRWRELNELAQQDIHEWGQVAKAKIFNSQIAYLETGRLDPKFQVLLGLEKFNNALAGQKIPGVRDKFNEIRRDRLKKAEPFYTHDGRIATATDFFSMMIGQQEINKKYTSKDELTPEVCSKYGQSLERTFNKIAHERLLSSKKAWDELAKTKGWPKEKNYQTVCKDILRGEHELTPKEVAWCLKLGKGECPCYRGLSLLANKQGEDIVDISTLTRANKKLLEAADV
jgi:transcriptional regulator with XRE-family HTH domain